MSRSPCALGMSRMKVRRIAWREGTAGDFQAGSVGSLGHHSNVDCVTPMQEADQSSSLTWTPFQAKTQRFPQMQATTVFNPIDFYRQ